MSDKDLQQLTGWLSDIGQATSYSTLPFRRHQIIQNFRITGQRTLYLSVDHNAPPAELTQHVKDHEWMAEIIGLYDMMARLMSPALQYGLPIEKPDNFLAGAKFAFTGPTSGHDRLKHCSSVLDLIGRCLLRWSCGQLTWLINSVLEA